MLTVIAAFVSYRSSDHDITASEGSGLLVEVRAFANGEPR